MKNKKSVGYNEKHFLSMRWRGLLAAATLSMLAACGGGGGASVDPQTVMQTIRGTIASGVTVIPEADAIAATLTLEATQNDVLLVTNPTGALASAKTGQIVALPANDIQGIPFGLTAKVERNADGSVALKPVALEEVFTKLNIDFDSARDGAKIAGLIGPTGGSLTLNQPSPSSAQLGLEYAVCQFGLQAVVNIKCKNGELEGSIGIQHKVNVKKKGSKETTIATLYGTIDIRKLAAKVKIEFDPEKYPSTGGFNQAMVKLTGEWGAQIGIKVDDDAAKVEIPSWSEIVRSDDANIWDENTKVKFGKYFELSGLNGDDKKGLIPLGGFYLTPVGTAVPFGGELSASQLGQIKVGAIVVWVYIDLAGNLTLSGDLNLLKFNGVYVEKGFEVTRVNDALKTSTFNVQTNPATLYAPYLKGSLEAKQNIGLAVAADLLVGGIRPFTVKAEVIGGQVSLAAQGEGGLRWYPEPSGFEGALCTTAEIEGYSDLVVKGRVNVKLDAGWLEVSGGTERTWGPFKKTWMGASRSGCFNTYLLALTAKVTGQDSNDPTKSKVEINFVDAFNNTPMRDQTGTWRLYMDGPLQSNWVDVDTKYGGSYSLPLPSGAYQFRLFALHKDLKDNLGQPLAVKESNKVSLTVLAVATSPARYVSQGGLTWMPVTFSMNFADANSYCNKTAINGQNGWRMAEHAELISLDKSGAMKDKGWKLGDTWSSTLPYQSYLNYLYTQGVPVGSPIHVGVILGSGSGDLSWNYDSSKKPLVSCVR